MSKAPPIGEGHGGSYGRYLSNKNAKLRQQFNEERSRFNLDSATSSSLFRNIVIYVNGHTVPSQQELKHLMALHGGGFESFYRRPPVTHFVCSHLPLAKIRQLRKERHPIPVVRPEWIPASIKAGRLLPFRDFALEELRQNDGQRLDGKLVKRARAAEEWPIDETDEMSTEQAKEIAYFKNSDLTPAAFIKSYFENSRLHFIGTWKMRIEAHMHQHPGAGPMPIKARGNQQCIIHVDMDCFFASVAVLKRPELRDKPFVVCHSTRRLGIRAGTFIANALRICPTLEVVPYQFQDYQDISEKVYEILTTYSACVEPVSCDEAYVDVTGLGDAETIAYSIRGKIEEMTRCTASAGVGPNKLLAKIGTTLSKPNGQRRIGTEEALDVLADLSINQLPRVGRSMADMLKDLGVETVSQLQSMDMGVLISEFGEKTGKSLSDTAHGIDDTPVLPPKVRKSVSAESNWGIRLRETEDVRCYLEEILRQVLHRMSFLKLRGRCVTLKLRTRQEDAPVVPAKFLGCGRCDAMSRSHTLDQFMAQFDVLMDRVWKTFLQTDVPVHEIRGLGITISKLDNVETQTMTLLHFAKKRDNDEKIREPPSTLENRVKIKKRTAKRKTKLPVSHQKAQLQPVRIVQPGGLSLADVDPHVLAALPTDIRQEIVQTIPLERGTLFADGNDRGATKTRTYLKDKEREAWLSRLRHQFQILLEVSDDVITWDDGVESEYNKGDGESIAGLLWKLAGWIRKANDLQMDMVYAALHIVRRLGEIFSAAFGECSKQFISFIQTQLRQQHGYVLDLDTCF